VRWSGSARVSAGQVNGAEEEERKTRVRPGVFILHGGARHATPSSKGRPPARGRKGARLLAVVHAWRRR
jgi:hypothetical protein